MRFLLDENVPQSVLRMLKKHGHDVEYIRQYVPPGSQDPLVATVAEEHETVLISFDGDFQKIAPRIPDGQKTRFKQLSRIWMRCSEPSAAKRLEAVLDFVEFEYAYALEKGDGRMIIRVGKEHLRTDR